MISWAVAHKAPLSMGFSRQEYWSELPFPSPGDLPDLEIEPRSPALAGVFCTTEPPGKPEQSMPKTLNRGARERPEEASSIVLSWRDSATLILQLSPFRSVVFFVCSCCFTIN